MTDLQLHEASELWITLIKNKKGYQAIDPSSFKKFLRKIRTYVFFQRLLHFTKPGSTVLEAGCGWALSSFALAERNIRSTAVDISPELIADLKTLQVQLGGNFVSYLECVVGDIFKLSALGKTVHVVYSDGTYELFFDINDRKRILKNFRSILTQDGTLVLAVPNLHNPFFGMAVDQTKMPAMQPFTLEILRSELEAGGFTILEDGYSFVNPGFEQWIRFRLLIYPVKIVNVVFRFLPRSARGILAAHLYVVAKKA